MDPGYDGGQAFPHQLSFQEWQRAPMGGGRGARGRGRGGAGRGRAAPAGSQEVCRYFVQGNCVRGESCNFLHPRDSAPPGASSSSDVCRNFLAGRCTRGEACHFLHPAGGAAPMGTGSQAQPFQANPEVCRNFMAGRCTRGESCHFLHPGPGGQQQQQPQPQRAGNGAQPDLRQVLSGSAGGGRSNVRRRPVDGEGGHVQKWGRQRGGRGPGDAGPAGGRFQDSRGPAGGKRVCFFWIDGNCRNGDNCNFIHAHSTMPEEVQMVQELKGHHKVVRAIAFQAEQPTLLYTGGQDETMQVWNAAMECTSTVNMGGDVGALLAQSGWLFVGVPNQVKTWVQATNAQGQLAGPQGSVNALHIIQDKLLAACQDGKILCWKFNAGSQAFEPHNQMVGHTGAVVCLSSMSVGAGECLVSGSMDKSLMIWDPETGQCLQSIPSAHQGAVTGLVQWNEYLLSCAIDGTVTVWGINGQTGLLEPVFRHPEAQDSSSVGATAGPAIASEQKALAMAVAKDGSGADVLLVAFLTEPKSLIRVFDLPTFNERGSLYSRKEVRVLYVAQGVVVSGDASGQVKIWRFLQKNG